MNRRRSVNSTTASHHSRGPLQVGEAVADHERRAARVAAGERVARLAAERDGHRLVEQADPLVDAPLPHGRAAELGERHALDVGIAQLVGDVERRARVALGLGRVGRALGVLDRQPAVLGAGRLPSSRRRARAQPPGGRGVAAVDAVLAGQIRRRCRRPARASPRCWKRRVGLAPAVDPRVALPEPPQRLPEPVERLGVTGVGLERRGERVARARPSRRRRSAPRRSAWRSSVAYSRAIATQPTADLGFDLSSIEFWLEWSPEQRDAAFRQLRAERPVSWWGPVQSLSLPPEMLTHGYWALTRYDDIRQVSRDHETFCSGEGVMFFEAPPEMFEATLSFIAMDAPRHTKLRGLVSSAFTPRQVARLEERIAVHARDA